MNIIQDSIKTTTRILLIAAFALVPIVPESVLADPSSRAVFQSPQQPVVYESVFQFLP